MNQTGNEALWQHMAELRPRLREHVRLLPQDYRGERWYVLHDESAGRFLRFNASAYEVLGRLDGDLTVQEILDLVNEARDDTPMITPDEVMQLLAQLHGAEVLRVGLPVSAQGLLFRYQQSQRSQRRRVLMNPLALRIPFFDPDRLLSRLTPLARMAFSPLGFWLWVGIVGLGLTLGLANLSELGAAVQSKELTPQQVALFWVLYPIVKALHELGHGLAVKAWGGEVHETGITLLVFMPVPYVDASAAWAFRDKRRRALVGAAGILVELFLAALGILVWLAVEPGLVREAALNVALIGGISTILFNGNPLLRFDGYYVLEDLIEVPNLASRSARYYLYLMQRYLLGLVDAQSPVTAHGERSWFAFYGFASPVYRLFVMIGIALYLVGEFLVVGVVLASWAIFMQLVRPLYRAVNFLATSPRLTARRMRGFAVVGGFVAAVGAVPLIPAPLVTQAEGVVWLNERSQVVGEADGFVTQVLVRTGETVRAGDLLLRLEDGELNAQHVVLEARLRELRVQQVAERQQSRVRAAMVAEDIVAVSAELAQSQERLDALEVRSPAEGEFVPHEPHELVGRFVRHGEVLGYVLNPQRRQVRAVLEQDGIGLLRARQTSIEIMLADRLGEAMPVELLRVVPAGSVALPSRALGAAGGGKIAVDGTDETGLTATQRVFQLDLALPADAPVTGIGERAYVRLDHGLQPLWRQWTRSLRQLLLSRLET
jgi:putative peptide zinc metalloprotease protein